MVSTLVSDTVFTKNERGVLNYFFKSNREAEKSELTSFSQHHLLIDLLSLGIQRDIEDSYIRDLIRYVKLLFVESPPRGDYDFEFDAKAIETMAVEMWHFGERDGAKIAETVRTGARELRPFDRLS